ncbi:MAG: RNA helicase [Deltaproteobacteria bacterium]|nr:MAG: RNA helicase [Deltaproteobacteria bacterium]
MRPYERFKALGLSHNVVTALVNKGFEEPTPIQEQTIPLLLAGSKDLIGQAQTGTGKTAAFGVPLIEQAVEDLGVVQAIVLTPTRELAIQVAEDINSLKGSKKIRVMPVYGGQAITHQLRGLRQGVDIVVGTPGRVLDHLQRKTLRLDHISHFVLDEADEMLNMGFIEDIEAILETTNTDKTTLFFSATMPREILAIAKTYMRDYEIVSVRKQEMTADLTDQIYFEVNENDKFEALCRIIDMAEACYAIVFCRTKVEVDQTVGRLMDRGYDAEGLHGDISQGQREKILDKFKKHHITILVATDVAARGIDVNNLTHVINYALPQNPESYVHRIGRTGRAGKAGTAITFITPSQSRRLLFIQRATRSTIRKERLPKVTDIIRAKKNRIISQIRDDLHANIQDHFREMAATLLAKNNQEDILAAVLQHAFKDDLDASGYHEIRDVFVDNKGTTRLFVAQGRTHGMSPKKLVNMMHRETGVRTQAIQGVQVLEGFSFMTVPFREAGIILSVFKKQGRGKKPLVVKAKPLKQPSKPPFFKRTHRPR